METGSRPTAKSPEIVRDEAKVLGLYVTVRTFGQKSILPTIVLPDEKTPPVCPGRWVAAHWRGALLVPFDPVREVRWSGTSWTPADGRALRQRITAVLWWIDPTGSQLAIDRVVWAVSVLTLLEPLHSIKEEKILIKEGQILRRLLHRLNEAAKDAYVGRAAKSALAKAEVGLRRDAARIEVLRIETKARWEDFVKRRDSVLGGVDPVDRRPNNPRVWPFFAEAARLRHANENQAIWNHFWPRSLLVELQAARSAGPAELEALRHRFREHPVHSQRSNANPAFELDKAFGIERWGNWSSSTAARLWVRATSGRNPELERRIAQAVDDARRRARSNPRADVVVTGKHGRSRARPSESNPCEGNEP
jgi:hypothetical protein